MSIAHGIKRLGVLGAGQMGTGIAFVSALHAKVPVLLHDKSAHQVSKGITLIDKLLAKDVSKGRLQPSDAEEARARIQTVDAIEAMRDVDMVVEAVTENLDLKRAIFREFAAKIRPDAILATNTSSISITKIAGAVIPEGVSAAGEEGKAASGRVVGLHFFNPVPVMWPIDAMHECQKLVELISAVQTSQDTLDRSRAFAEACGKEVATSQDVPGFVSNALLMPFINEAIMCLEKGVATRDDIDKTFRLGMAHPMGPLQLGELLIGLDTCLFIQQTLYKGTSDSKYRPSVLLERMVDAQYLGKKSGRGFYEYNN
ncbi:3-hydroxyacyl-CoA dehydrogenase [Suillus occidentalis]|nr:3-hydroxyacyl-CoA dehydrogenase [Suillus occidentalis]